MLNSSYKIALSALVTVGCVTNINASSIKEIVEHTMVNNPKIVSTIKNNEAYRLYIDEAKGGYLPRLDLTAYLGTKKTETDPDVGPNTKESTKGGNLQLDFEQLIYDGGLTIGEVDEAKFRYNSNKYLNDSIVDDIIYDSIDSYLNLVKYKNRLNVTEESLSIYNEYYEKAKDTENITGVGLHKSQVNAKVHLASNNLYRDKNSHLSAASSFKKNVGLEADGNSCRPNIDETFVPTTLKALVDDVLVKNPLILEQVENIKEQRAILNQKDASFYPTIKFKAQGIYDKDLITEDEKTEVYSARIELAYNIFNGNSDRAASMRERLFLEESQKELDTVTRSVIDETTNAYNTYTYAKKREVELKKYIQDNQEILAFYKDQFEGGTRTFIDVLNIERDLISAKESLVDLSYDIDSSYFMIFNNLGLIKESVVRSNNPACQQTTTTVTELPTQIPVEKDVTVEEVQTMLSDDAVVYDETYALYLAAYKNMGYAEEDAQRARELLDMNYSVKIEQKKGLNSVVVYDIITKEEAQNVKSRLTSSYPGLFVRKITR